MHFPSVFGLPVCGIWEEGRVGKRGEVPTLSVLFPDIIDVISSSNGGLDNIFEVMGDCGHPQVSVGAHDRP